MIRFLARRFGTMLVTLAAVSVLIFGIINLPEGNYLSNQIAEMRATGEEAGIARAEALMREYALDRPIWEQYLVWVGLWPGVDGFSGLLQGDLGWSFELDQPVANVVGETVWLTVLVNFSALMFVYIVALPLGTLAAVRANGWIDYACSFVGYIGLATPNFLLALILLAYGAVWFDIPIGGLMHRDYEGEPMSWGKLGSILMHLIVPTVVIGTSAAAAVMRRLRANLLDELHKPYVETARAKGVPPIQRIIRYPLRMALNPFVADIGNLMPQLVSGSVIISVVMSLPTLGPVLLHALKSQDIYMSGFILLFVSALTLVGMLISDILLAVLDPRIRLGAGAEGRLMLDRTHWVLDEPFDPETERQLIERADLDAPTRVLVWRRFKRHRLGVACLAFLVLVYGMLPFVETIAPYPPNVISEDSIYAPPQGLHLWHEGAFVGLHTYPTATVYDVETGLVRDTIDRSRPLPVPILSTCGPSYALLGLVESRFHLICPPEGGSLYLLGSDRLGRDVLSRILHGARLSMTIGLIGVAVSFTIGLVLGGAAGYFGGWVDATVQRLIEVFRSLPELPIWLALSAAVPVNWNSLAVFIMISVILGLLDWPGLARAVRSKFLALREEDYVRAAELMGARPARVIRAHMMPNFMSHLIASASLSIPAMILGETALSFLGFGIRSPLVSWGLMLNDALRAGLGALEIYPWIMTPMIPVILVVLAFSFVGDALRDALDPYS